MATMSSSSAVQQVAVDMFVDFMTLPGLADALGERLGQSFE